jgi:PilZ domain-containing protein
MPDSKIGDIEFERREFPRFVIHLPFSYELDHIQGEGITSNASQGGVQVYLPDEVQESDLLRFKLVLPEGNGVRSVQATARVVWSHKSDLPAPKNFKAGLEFVDISDDGADFLKWFEQLWLNQGS